jgi:MarR family transcriptional regulator, multiple antibiotic resistance protein MarR
MPVKFAFSEPLSKTWLLVHQCHRLMTRMENQILTNVGLTTRKHAVLFALRNLPDPVTVTDVAHWLDRNPNGISMLVDRMLTDGLISRDRDMDDRRSVRLKITSKGEQAIDEGNKLTRQAFKELFGEISDEELKNVSKSLEKIRFKSLDFLKLEYAKHGVEILNGPTSRKSRTSSVDDQDSE